MDLERQTLGLGHRPALILVDLIRGFTDSTSPLGTDCPAVIEANATLLRLFRERGLPVFFTTVVYHNDEQARVFRARLDALNILQPESAWIQVDPALAPGAGEKIIEKQWASAFFGTTLQEELAVAARLPGFRAGRGGG
jgi:nicotinamidase-related amidase